MFLAVVLGVSGNLQDEVAVSCFTVITRCLSCYLLRPEQALTSSSSVSFSRAEEFTYRSDTGSAERSSVLLRAIWGDTAVNFTTKCFICIRQCDHNWTLNLDIYTERICQSVVKNQCLELLYGNSWFLIFLDHVIYVIF